LKKENCYEKFILQKELPSSTTESIIVIPKFSEKGQGYIVLDSYILIVETKTGEIKSKFHEKKSWYSDAIILESIKIDTASYILNKNTRAFGVRVKYYNTSRPDPYEVEELSLFIRNRVKLERILKKFQTYIFNGQTNAKCTGEFEEHKKTILISKNQTNDYYDLKIIDNITKSESTEIDCERKIIEEKKHIEYLKYNNGEYKNVL